MASTCATEWNEEAVLVALQPWELDVIDRGLACLAALALTHSDWHHVQGQEHRAMAVIEKLDQVLGYQGFPDGIDGIAACSPSARPRPRPAATPP